MTVWAKETSKYANFSHTDINDGMLGCVLRYATAIRFAVRYFLTFTHKFDSARNVLEGASVNIVK